MRNQLYDKGNEDAHNDNFNLRQEIERLKHDLLLSQNEKFSLKSEIDLQKLKNQQLSAALDNKERSYNELKSQIKEMQIQIEKARRNGSEGSYTSPALDFRFNNSIYESPYRQFGAISGFSGNEDNLSEILKSAQDEDSARDKDSVEVPKTIKLSLATSEPISKVRSTAEKYFSQSVGAALTWGGDHESTNITDTKPESSIKSPTSNIDIDVSSGNKDFKDKMEELAFNIAEEKRLAELIRNPPVQFRKHKKQQQLKEELKKAQRKIYELNFYIKSNSS